MLGNKPKYSCVQECRNEAKKIKAEMSMEKAKVQQQIDQVILAYEQAKDTMQDTQGKVAWDLCLVQIMELLRRWQEVARVQVEFIEDALD